MSKDNQTKRSELEQLLSMSGYEVVIGYENVKKLIKEKSDGKTQLLCSGYRIFPDGKQCDGCPDCENV